MNYESQLWKKEQDDMRNQIVVMRKAIIKAYNSAVIASNSPDLRTTETGSAIREVVGILAQLLFTPFEPGLSTNLEGDGEKSPDSPQSTEPKENALTTFFRKRREEDEKRSGEHAGRKRNWRIALDALYDKIKSWLSEAQELGLVSFMEGTVELHERDLGSYFVSTLVVFDGNRRISIIPIAEHSPSISGLAHLECGDKMRVLSYDSDHNWCYHHGGSPYPERDLLDAQAFEGLLREMLDS